MPILAVAWSLPAAHYQEFGHERKFLNDEWAAIAVLCALSYASGALIIGVSNSGRRRQNTQPEEVILAPRQLSRAFFIIAGIAIIGNMSFVLPILLNPTLIVDWLSGSISGFAVLKDQVFQIPGVTSVSNVAPLAVTLFALKPRLTGRRWTKVEIAVIAFVFVAIMLRSSINSERLAVIEVAVPMGVVLFGSRGAQAKPWMAVAPIFGIAALVGLFLVTEYFRSWTFYRFYYDDYYSFATSRIWGYYTTALNNGAGLAELFPPSLDAQNTMAWFYKFPLFPWVQPTETNFQDFAFLFASSEFNNRSGVFAPIHDFGIVGGFVFWFVFGLVSGAIYEGYKNGQLYALLLHPTWIIGSYEFLRVFYWGHPRYFPTLVLAIMLTFLLSRYRHVRYTPIEVGRAHPLAPVRRNL
ncbi:MAG: oligosaccharide repeat unit polymerase [Alphaproteobacteria bacterium]|nr:oligosaccharide repeat unit polymerase [Alphaproteobacteria bacterium]